MDLLPLKAPPVNSTIRLSTPRGALHGGAGKTSGAGLEAEGPCPDRCRHGIEFRRRVVAAYVSGELAHVLGRRHDLSRNLIRIRVEKAGAGALDRDQEAADLLGAYEARIAALERPLIQQTLEIAFLRKARKIAPSQTSAPASATTGPAASRSSGGARRRDWRARPSTHCGEALGRRPRRRDPRRHRRVRVLRLPSRRRRAASPRQRDQCQEGAPAHARARARPTDAAAFPAHDGQVPRWAVYPFIARDYEVHRPEQRLRSPTSPASRSPRDL